MQPLIAGRGWRALVIGAALKDVVADLGAPSHTRKFDDFISVDWRPLGIKAYLDLDERVTIVTAVFREIYVEGFTPFAATTEHGIGGDATPEQIEAAHGPAPERRGNKGEHLVYEGLLFSFYEGELHEITVDPTNRPVQRPPLPPPHPLNELGRRALELVADLERRITALARPNVRLVFTPTEPAWLDNFEHRIGHRLPPSYRQLALTRGTFHVQVDHYRTFWMIPVEKLGGPGPTSWVDEGEEEVDDLVNRAIYFAYAHDDAVENFYAFDPTTADERGEMSVGLYYHDERFEGGGMSFVEYLEREIDHLFKYYVT